MWPPGDGDLSVSAPASRRHSQHRWPLCVLSRSQEFREKTGQAEAAGVNLYVKNLDESVSDASLRELFEPFGSLTSCIAMKDVDRRHVWQLLTALAQSALAGSEFTEYSHAQGEMD